MPARPSRLRALAANLAVLLVGIAASILLLELALRIYNPLPTRIKGDRIVLEANTRARHKSNLTSGPNGLDSEITESRNALGFRGPNPPARFAEYLTLVAVGGSTTRCAMQSDDKTWAAHLGRLLDQSFHDVWINNAGLDGHTTHGHLVLLRDHIAQLHPKVVLFLVGLNEIYINPEPNQWDAGSIRHPPQPPSLRSLLRSLSAYSEVVAVSLDLYRSVLARRGGLGHFRVDLASLGDYESAPEQERAHREEFAGPGQLAGYDARLESLIAEARAAAIEPIFLTQPLLVGRGVDDVTGRDLARVVVPRHGNGKMFWDVLETYNDVTRRVCRENDVFLIDLAREMPKSSRYYYDYMHYNNDGTGLVAQLVYRSLCSHLARRYPRYFTHPCPEAPQ